MASFAEKNPPFFLKNCSINLHNISGLPIRNLNIQCWSLFRDQDFHTRFHFDHYEHSGQWHGQYRGYKHGRVHDFHSSHEHLLDVALAMELSLASTWICSAMWFALTTLMILLKRRQKFLQKRELAESIEDAAIFASSRQLDPTQNIMMKPIDQVHKILFLKTSLLLIDHVFLLLSVSSVFMHHLCCFLDECDFKSKLSFESKTKCYQRHWHFCFH